MNTDSLTQVLIPQALIAHVVITHVLIAHVLIARVLTAPVVEAQDCDYKVVKAYGFAALPTVEEFLNLWRFSVTM